MSRIDRRGGRWGTGGPQSSRGLLEKLQLLPQNRLVIPPGPAAAQYQKATTGATLSPRLPDARANSQTFTSATVRSGAETLIEIPGWISLPIVT